MRTTGALTALLLLAFPPAWNLHFTAPGTQATENQVTGAEAFSGCAGAPDGTLCDDLNACTLIDRCHGGQCVAAGTGTFTQAPGSPFSGGGFIHAIAVGDFNLDGKSDLALGGSYN